LEFKLTHCREDSLVSRSDPRRLDEKHCRIIASRRGRDKINQGFNSRNKVILGTATEPL
jgi:hypothetical protein